MTFDFEAELARAKTPAVAQIESFGPLINGHDMLQRTLPLPPEMICGLLAQGEKGELAGGSKSFKTWALIHQALSIATGTPWWGFNCLRNNVIFLNLEIPQPFFEERVRTVAATLELEIPANFHMWHLRNGKLGDLLRWSRFLEELRLRCTDIKEPFLTSDPIYKLLGGRNENSAGDVATLLEQLDDMVAFTNGANFFGHHFAKGTASEKEVIDRAAGSGVFQRDPDSILVMSPHEKDGAFTIDSILRNHPPVSPFVIEWHYPLFVRTDLDPTELKPPRTSDKRYHVAMLPKFLGQDHLSTTQLLKRLSDETGMSKPTFYRLLPRAEKQKLIFHDDITKTWEIPMRPT